jgi:hypothetical protein
MVSIVPTAVMATTMTTTKAIALRWAITTPGCRIHRGVLFPPKLMRAFAHDR